MIFAVVHSGLATERVRARFERGIGARTYRLLYNVLAIGLLAAAFWISRGEHRVVWEVHGAARYALRLVQALAAAGMLASALSFDLGYFAGLRQLRGATERGGLRTGGVYALCRHPLYFFTAVAFSAWPRMDLRLLVLAVWLWAYAYVGSIFEERRLERVFGAEYRRYQRTHHRLLPMGRRSPSAH